VQQDSGCQLGNKIRKLYQGEKACLAFLLGKHKKMG
jgi:hypothetical protein